MPMKKVPRDALAAEIAEIEKSFHIVSITTTERDAEIVYEQRGNRAPGEVETRAEMTVAEAAEWARKDPRS